MGINLPPIAIGEEKQWIPEIPGNRHWVAMKMLCSCYADPFPYLSERRCTLP
jgi:hypothetical protein